MIKMLLCLVFAMELRIYKCAFAIDNVSGQESLLCTLRNHHILDKGHMCLSTITDLHDIIDCWN